MWLGATRAVDVFVFAAEIRVVDRSVGGRGVVTTIEAWPDLLAILGHRRAVRFWCSGGLCRLDYVPRMDQIHTLEEAEDVLGQLSEVHGEERRRYAFQRWRPGDPAWLVASMVQDRFDELDRISDSLGLNVLSCRPIWGLLDLDPGSSVALLDQDAVTVWDPASAEQPIAFTQPHEADDATQIATLRRLKAGGIQCAWRFDPSCGSWAEVAA